jgi:serine/threonine protein kinase
MTMVASHRRPLNIDVDLINEDRTPKKKLDFDFGDTTYRQDGFSIGRDYLRYDGTTMTRGGSLLLPESLGLTVDQLLGQGAFSKVHKGIWKSKEKGEIQVAVKQCCILESSAERRSMLLAELKALCKVDCDCLVRFEGAFLKQDSVFVIMEYMDRGSLEQLLHSKPPFLSSTFVATAAFQMLWGLSYLHHERVLHRDIKPGNVLLHSNGYVKLCDFGMATMSDQTLNTTMVGTTRYMAPERLRAKAYSRPSDIWSLGLVILELATRKEPWPEADSIISLLMLVEETSLNELVPHGIDFDLREVLLACLHQNPGKMNGDADWSLSYFGALSSHSLVHNILHTFDFTAKRIPADVLLLSPWFQSKGLRRVGDAVAAMKKELETIPLPSTPFIQIKRPTVDF